jgi:hypothetical protein
LQQDEHHENGDKSRGRKRVQQRRYERSDALQRAWGRLAHLDRDRLGLLAWNRDWAAGDHVLRSVKLFAEILKDVGRSLESSARCRRAAQRSDLLTHGDLVARKITCELRDLCRDHATDEKDACEREQDDTDD